MPNPTIKPDPIKHVVVLMLENHPFDQMLGALRQLYPGLDGIDPQNPHSNIDAAGKPFSQIPTTERQMTLDPHHEVEHVAVQLANGNSGFLEDFSACYPDSSAPDRQFVMGYYPLDFLPATHGLARDFLVCDRWFSSVPGPTWPNRFFALSGTSCGRVNMPSDGHHWLDIQGWFEQDQATLFERLNEKGISWKVYFHDVPISWVLMNQRKAENVVRYFPFEQFAADASGAAEAFPAFCFLEPDYQGVDENDDHPPHDVMRAQKFVADVYNALRANEQLWNSTLFVVLYDEHGGFYDHVVPPAAPAPDAFNTEFTFDRFGVRVPALLISPWVKRGYDSTQFDHTSLLKYLIEKWGLGTLGQRAAQANSIAPLIGTADVPRTDTVRRIELTADQQTPPKPDVQAQAGNFISEHHRSIVLLSQFLHRWADEEIPRAIVWLVRLFYHLRGKIWALFHRQPATAEAIRKRWQTLEKETVPWFLRRARTKALPLLAAKLRDTSLPEESRRHAAESIGYAIGKPLRQAADPCAGAEAALKELGY